MDFLKKNGTGLLVCFLIALPSWLLGKKFPIVGGAVIAILLGMMITLVWKEKGGAQPGIKWTSKIILQSAVVLLGFGMNLNVVLQTGKESLPIIVCTITTSLVIAWVLHRVMHIHGNTATLIGVGSSICGGSAIAAAAPVVGADDNEVAQSISVIFFFNVLAAIFFPMLGNALGFTTTGQYVESGQCDAGQGGDGQAHPDSGDYSDHTGAGAVPGPGGEAGRGSGAEKRRVQSEAGVPDVPAVLRDRLSHHHGLHFHGSAGGGVRTTEGAE